MGLPPWAPNGETFLLFTDKAIGSLDEELRAFMAVSELYVADLPGPEVVVDGIDPRTMVLVDALLVGPEGGLTTDEVDLALASGFTAVFAIAALGAVAGFISLAFIEDKPLRGR